MQYLRLLSIALMGVAAVAPLGAMAQTENVDGISASAEEQQKALEDVQFDVLPPVVPAPLVGDMDLHNQITNKVVQILTRLSAGAAGKADVFVIQPVLEIDDVKSTSGTVRTVNVASGSLTLIAMNKVDGATYHTVTVPLESVTKGMDAAVASSLVKGIRPNEPVFSRFVRTARKHIADYYTTHCSEILQRAASLRAAGDYATAAVYLLGVPGSAPCASEASAMIGEMRREVSQPEAAPARQEATDENVVETPQEHDSPAQTAPKIPATTKPDIYVSNHFWKCEVVAAKYLPANREVVVQVRLVTEEAGHDDVCVLISDVIDSHGVALGKGSVTGGNWKKFPQGVDRIVEMVFPNIYSNPQTLSYYEFRVGNVKIEIKNLTISE